MKKKEYYIDLQYGGTHLWYTDEAASITQCLERASKYLCEHYGEWNDSDASHRLVYAHVWGYDYGSVNISEFGSVYMANYKDELHAITEDVIMLEQPSDTRREEQKYTMNRRGKRRNKTEMNIRRGSKKI